MKLRHVAIAIALSGFTGVFPAGATAQDLRRDLAKFVEVPAVSGYEQTLGKEIKAKLAKWKPQVDSMGNVIITAGSGAPVRVIATPMDEAGYVVSGITDDGYLRVQREPNAAPFAYYDAFYAAQPVHIQTRSGKMVPGVVAGLSTHLQGGRLNPPRADNLDDIYVDIGANSKAEARATGVDVLDPISINRHLYEMAFGRFTSPAIGDRFGCAALVEMLRNLNPANVHGTLVVAFLAQQLSGARGIDRLLQSLSASQKPDEVVYVGRMIPRRPTAAQLAAAAARGGARGGAETQAAPAGRGGRGGLQPVEPKAPDGSGALIGDTGSAATEGAKAFAASLKSLAEQNGIKATTDVTIPLPRGRDAIAVPLPQKVAQLGIPVLWPSTPGEIIDSDDLVALTRLLEVYAQGSAATQPLQPAFSPLPRPSLPPAPKVAPTPVELVSKLTEAYGVSTYRTSWHEDDMRALVMRLLPPWAKPETNETGDIWVHVGSGGKDSKTPHLAVVAHMDEIGFEVVGVSDDGRLQVVTRGGGIMYFFAAHTVLVHTAKGDFPGVIQLPAGWYLPGFTLAGGGAAAAAGGAGGAGAAAGGRGAPAGGPGGETGAEQEVGGGGAQGGGRGAAAGGMRLLVDIGARSKEEAENLGITVGTILSAATAANPNAVPGDFVTIPKKYIPLAGHKANARSFDDRVGCAAAISAIWALGPQVPGRDITFIFSWGEELGLFGASAAAKKMAAEGHTPDYVFAIDTFVSSDSPLESKRFADAILGQGFVVRAVDGSNITPRELSDKVVRICKANGIPVQYGITGGGNDGATFLPYGTLDVGMGWPLRYSHSPGEVIDTRDLDALARVLAAVAKSW